MIIVLYSLYVNISDWCSSLTVWEHVEAESRLSHKPLPKFLVPGWEQVSISEAHLDFNTQLTIYFYSKTPDPLTRFLSAVKWNNILKLYVSCLCFNLSTHELKFVLWCMQWIMVELLGHFFLTQKPPIVTGISVRNLGPCTSSHSMLEGCPVGCYMGLGQATMVAVHL